MLSLVVVAALVVLIGTVKNAEAAGCPPHGPYYDYVMDASQWRENHYPEVTVVMYDKYGNPVEMYDSNEAKLKVLCVKSQYRYHIGIYCEECDWFVNDYWYEEEIVHSFVDCPDK